jgi:WD40 repeat protein
VTDFGLAKWLTNPSETSAKPDLTRTGMVVGTASYMAPEQAQNQPLTTSADVYALGVILFELLTGRTPFLGRTVLDILLQVVEKEAPRPRSLNPRVDPDLELICLKCLEKDPAQRFGSAAALAEELENWSAGEAISIRPPGRLTRVRRWCRRNPLPALLWAGLLLCLTVVVVGSPVAVFLIDAERRNSDSIAAKLEVQNDTLASTNEQLNTALGNLKTSLTNESTARSETALEREKLRRQLVRRYVGDGSRLLDDGDTLGALVWFAGALALDQGDPEREALHRLRVGMVLQRSPRLLQAWFVDKPLLDATFSSDGQRVCGVGQDGVARTWTVGKEKATFQFGEAMRKAAFTRDGNRLLAVHGDGKARLWDTATGKVVHEFAHDAVNAATLSVNEAWVVTAGQDGTARAWELANLKRAPRQTPRGSALHYAAVGPHGRVIIASGENETVWWHWHDRAKGRPAGFEALKKMPANVESATFGLDDSLVLTLHHSLPNRPHLWSVSAQSVERKPAPERLLRGEPELCFGPRKGLLLTVEGAAAQAWDSADGKLVGPRFPHAGDVTHAVFSPDGKRVFTACTDRTARVWDAQTGEPLTPAMTRPAGVIARASFSMEGRRLLLASNQQAGPNTIEVLEIAAPETAYHKPEGPWGPHTVFSVDGRLALTSSSDQTTVQMWEVAPKNSQMIGASPRLTTPATLAIFSPENKHVLVSDRTTLHVGHIGDAASGKTLKWLTIQASGELRQAAVTGDGTRVVALSRHENQSLLETWDAATGKAVGTAFKQPRPEARLEKLSPDGRLLVLARPLVAQLNLLDVATRKVLPVSPLVHSVRVNAAAFSPDARQLVTACVDRTAQVWDTVKGEPVAALVPLQSAILGFTFRGDGRMLATIHARDGGGDREGGAVRVWDTATWQPLTPLLAHDRVVRVAFGPDGRSIITSAADDNVRVWDLRAATGTPGDLVEQANLMAGRRLHENGYLVPLEEGSLRKVWPALRKHLTQ